MLRLHRSASERRLAEAGAKLDRLSMPTKVIWGERDPWFPWAFADRYRQRLPDADVCVVADAGHWPWIERPEAVQEIVDFLAAR